MALELAQALQQIDQALDQFRQFRAESKYDDCSDKGKVAVTAMITTLASTMERVAPRGNFARKSLEQLLTQHGPTDAYMLKVLPGLLESLKQSYLEGHFEMPEVPGPTTARQPLVAPDKVTIRWLIDHVPWGAWTTLAAIIVGSFVAGLYMGQVGWVRELLHQPPIPSSSALSGGPERNIASSANASVPSPKDAARTESAKESSRIVVDAKSKVQVRDKSTNIRSVGVGNNGSVGTLTQGPCSVAQIGGSENTATGGNCGPPPLVMTTSQAIVPSDKEGLIKTVITVIPNSSVSAPTGIAVEFDHPITSMGFWVSGAGAVMGGGPFRIGTHALITIGTGFNQTHPLLLTVYSVLPVNVIKPPTLE